MTNANFTINPVRSSFELQATLQLFQAYAASLEIDLAYQDFSTELATLPGDYTPPNGELLLAQSLKGEPLGCVGLRAMRDEGCCEMKRLYVCPTARGLGLGEALVNAIISEAIKIGYHEICLDTLPSMSQAITLYKKLGFVPIEPYYKTPVTGTLFFRAAIASDIRTR